ncbi:YqaA family protein [Terriglobus sp. RCC_193]|uniref:YqaA family protein n=1 Tax=Terriglobus sp. RCC_193 TaxID=3239218 RepID=UPI0035254E01
MANGIKHRHAYTPTNRVTRYFFSLGLLGLFFISVIDSSPIPLPIPGSSDILVTLLAAQRQEWLVVTLIATLGSVVGAAISYHAGRIGGFALMDRYVPQRFRDRMRRWTEEHAILSTALPAILPPPAPLMPFLIAAGALKMPPSKFYSSFTISRFFRHAFFAWLGMHYGRHIMRAYLHFAEKYGWILLVAVWGSVLFGAIYAIVKLRQNRLHQQSATPSTAAAA